MQQSKSFRLGLVVTRDFSPETSWGRLLEHVRAQGHEIVASKQPLPVSALASNDSRVQILAPDITEPDYLTAEIEPSAVEMLRRFIGRLDYPSTHAVLLTMLSRRDSTGSFRTLDREAVIRHLLLSLTSQLIRAEPTHLIFDETPHEAADFALYQLARFIGIPCLFFQPSLVGPQLVARTGIDNFLSVPPPRRGSFTPGLERARAGATEISRAAVRKLQRGGGTALLDRQRRVDQRAAGRVAKLRALAWTFGFLWRGDSNELVTLTGHRAVAKLVRNIYQVVASRSLQNSLRNTILRLPNKPPSALSKYAVFALHYEPERTNMPEGLPYLSQLDAVLAARSLLPDDVVLLVKEHYAQQSSSLRGHVGRSLFSYSYLDRIPGVELLGVDMNTRELVKGSVAVFTMTGKIGIEAAFLGTPAIYFGQPWWGGMPGAWAFSDLKDFEDVARSSAPPDQAVFGWFETQIDERLLFGLGGTSPEKYSARISPLPEGFEELEFESLARALKAFLLQQQ